MWKRNKKKEKLSRKGVARTCQQPNLKKWLLTCVEVGEYDLPI